MSGQSRRDFLQVLVTGSAAVVSGCTGGVDLADARAVDDAALDGARDAAARDAAADASFDAAPLPDAPGDDAAAQDAGAEDAGAEDAAAADGGTALDDVPWWKADLSAAAVGNLTDADARACGYDHRQEAQVGDTSIVVASALGTAGTSFGSGAHSYAGRPARARRSRQQKDHLFDAHYRTEIFALNVGNNRPASEFVFAPGVTAWTALAVMLPTVPATTGDSWLTIAQWKGTSYYPGATRPTVPDSGSPPLALTITSGRFSLDVQNTANLFGPSRVVANRWYWIEVCATFVPQPDGSGPHGANPDPLGHVRVYIDGESTPSIDMAAHTMDMLEKTSTTPDPLYFKSGVYRGSRSLAYEQVVHHALERVGPTRASVQPWT